MRDATQRPHTPGVARETALQEKSHTLEGSPKLWKFAAGSMSAMSCITSCPICAASCVRYSSVR
jgi:hypothetical protein